MAARTRQLQDSIEYRLSQILFQQGWVISQENLSLVAVAGEADTYTITSTLPWVFFDVAGKNTSDANVRVYRDGAMLPNSDYEVDYRLRRIIILSPAPGSLTADITTLACHLWRGYPTEEELELLDLPVVAFTVDDQSTQPFAIGTSLRHRIHPLQVDLLAANDTQQVDLADDIVDFLIRTGLIDTSISSPLQDNGRRNEQFDFDAAFVCWIQVAGLRGKRVAPRQNGSEKERFRSLITADLRIVR